MEKDAYYFPHFSNARNDRKIKRITKELGVEGYGIYFMLLEVLRDQSNFRYPIDDIDLLADEFNTSEQKVRTVISNYQLFEVDENQQFFSSKFYEFMQPYLNMKEQRRLAGVASGEARRKKSLIERPLNDRSATVKQPLNEIEQRKGKESKVKDIKEVIDFLNFTLGTKYLATTAVTKKHINARFEESFTVNDFKSVITKKYNQWKDDVVYSKYLRPETLFGTKFEGYLNEGKKSVPTVKIDRTKIKEVMLDELYS